MERETIGLIQRERTKTEGIGEKRDKLPLHMPPQYRAHKRHERRFRVVREIESMGTGV